MALTTGKSDMMYFPVHLAVLQPGTLAPVDLYHLPRGASDYVLYKGAGTLLREEIRDRLLDNNVTTLYLRQEDQQLYDDYLDANVKAVMRDDLLPRDEAGQIMYEVSGRAADLLLEQPESAVNLKRVETAVEAMVPSILRDPDILWHMTRVAATDYYIHEHCVHVSMLLAATATDVLAALAQEALEQVCLGGMLHDLGKSQIPERILTKPTELTPEEFDIIKQHPLVGLEIAESHRKLSPAAAGIIRSHHECYDGSGYPDRLAGDSIPPGARLAAIVDVYHALTTNRPYARALAPFDALRMMLVDMKGKFDAAMLRRFVRFLGPADSRSALRAG
jgi:putative nucleotidyltransferase with HDIG domain